MTKPHPIQSLRISCRVSQEDLGKMFKPQINHATISKIENGLREFPKRYDSQLVTIQASLEELKSLFKEKKFITKMRGRKVKSKKVSK